MLQPMVQPILPRGTYSARDDEEEAPGNHSTAGGSAGKMAGRGMQGQGGVTPRVRHPSRASPDISGETDFQATILPAGLIFKPRDPQQG